MHNRTKILKKENAYLLAFIYMDTKINRFTISRDMVFDEVSSLFFAQNVVVLVDDQDNLEYNFLK